jgi:23S rRNA (cytosine1962-C5)-methyltransferase
LFNPHSNIRVRLYDWNESGALDEAFWSDRLDRAMELRRMLFPDFNSNSAYRLVYSEGDGISGLIVDRYGDWLLVQFTSRALAERQETILRLLQEKIAPAGIWLRTEKGIRESEGLDIADGLVSGREPPRPLFIEEHGIRYGIDVVAGQKTGFYLDQRDNRAAVAEYVRGHRVLDLFCYTGGFGLAAVILGGAGEVLGIDVSEPALVVARANAELNNVSARMRFEKSTAFAALERLAAQGEKFDTVILDPPKLARNRAGVRKALRGYHSLNRLAVDVLNPNGILATCSCSGLVDRTEFEEMLSAVATDANRRVQILETRGQAADHPTSVHCVESSYLKCYVCRVE